MDTFQIVFALIFIAWMLKIALKPRVNPTRDDWLGVIGLLFFVPRKKKYFKEKFFE